VRVPDERHREAGTGGTLPRLGEMPLADLLPTDQTVLANAVRTVVEAAKRSTENYAAHSSTP
jgi:FXSXX-COOH protein